MLTTYSALIDWHLNLDDNLSDTISGFEVLDESLWVGNKRLELLSNPTSTDHLLMSFLVFSTHT